MMTGLRETGPCGQTKLRDITHGQSVMELDMSCCVPQVNLLKSLKHIQFNLTVIN